MIAIEFQAQIKNGMIEIPEAYRDQLSTAVRVIILAPERHTGTGIIAQLLMSPIQDPDFVPLTRDEIYGDRA